MAAYGRTCVSSCVKFGNELGEDFCLLSPDKGASLGVLALAIEAACIPLEGDS